MQVKAFLADPSAFAVAAAPEAAAAPTETAKDEPKKEEEEEEEEDEVSLPQNLRLQILGNPQNCLFYFLHMFGLEVLSNPQNLLLLFPPLIILCSDRGKGSS